LVQGRSCESHPIKFDPQQDIGDGLLSSISCEKRVNVSDIHVVLIVNDVGDADWVPIPSARSSKIFCAWCSTKAYASLLQASPSDFQLVT
jgi:hypothetical protein